MAQVEQILRNFESELEAESSQRGLVLAVAIGYEFVAAENDTIDLAFHRADKKMYQNKLYLKGLNNTRNTTI